MSKRIAKAFENGKAFISFLTAGDPSMEKSEEFILEMERAGADLVEIGIPFSDPIAEGVVIQDANVRALRAGASTEKVFELVASVRKKSQIPLVFLTYLNPLHYMGYEAFFSRCEEVGLDGIIIPDLPYDEKGEVKDIAAAHDIDIISMIAPTSRQRISAIAKDATGFLYVVSSLGVTGVRTEITTDLGSILQVIRENTKLPAAIGFGISTPQQAKDMAAVADGAIVGSAIVKLIAKYGEESAPYIYEYVKSMKDAVRELD